MTRSRLQALGLAACLALIATACSGDDDTTATTAQPAATTTQAAAGATTGAPGTTGGTEELPPITIGLITDLSGPFVSFGNDIEVATNLAVEAVNAEGGVNGSMLEIETVDTAGEPDRRWSATRSSPTRACSPSAGRCPPARPRCCSRRRQR